MPLLDDAVSVETLLSYSLASTVKDPKSVATAIVERLGKVGCKTALRLAERAVAAASVGDGGGFLSTTDTDGPDTDNDDGDGNSELGKRQLSALSRILDDLVGDEVTAQQLCEVI